METKKFEKKYGKYLPGYVSLYWVDCRDDLSNYMSIVQKAISSGEYYPITETKCLIPLVRRWNM